MEDLLPIKFFAKRKIDEMKVEGGGSNKLPKFVLSGNELTERVDQLKLNLNSIEQKFITKREKKSSIPMVIKVKMHKKALAKSHRQEISDFFNSTQDNIIGITNTNELLVKIQNDRELKTIGLKLSNPINNKYAISCIEEMDNYSPEIILEELNQQSDYKVKLINFQDCNKNKAIEQQFETFIKKENLDYKKTAYSDRLTVFSLKKVTKDDFNNIKEKDEDLYNAIFSISPMPQYHVVLDCINDNHEQPIITPEENKQYITVGILDSGIKDIPHLKPWIVDSYSPYPENLIDKKHGTFVAGVCLYGDQLESKNWVGNNTGYMLLDATIIPSNEETIYEDDLISNIKEAIERNFDKVPIWNLSVSIDRTIAEDSFSDFAVAIDELQKKYNILICKSAGNCSNFLHQQPTKKIAQGGDSVRSLVVGSIAHAKSTYDLSEIEYPSPFSRIGSGPSYIIKPDITHYGGNAGFNDLGNLNVTGVKSFGLDGGISTSVGTSFSTPRITALAAGIHQSLQEPFDPLLIKALIIHSAHYSKNINMEVNEKLKYMGFGKPRNINEILFNTPYEATLILRDNLAKGEFIDIKDFPMPKELVSNGFYTGQITVTLVTDPVLDYSQNGEYCQSDLQVKLGTYSEKIKRDTTKRNIKNELGRTEAKNILLSNLYSKKIINNVTSEFANSERMLIQYGDKYHPIKKYSVDLSEMTEANKIHYLAEDKSWYLNIEGIYRSFIENKAKEESIELSQDFCLIITIKDPDKNINIYDKVTQKLDEFNFTHNNIKLATDIDISI